MLIYDELLLSIYVTSKSMFVNEKAAYIKATFSTLFFILPLIAARLHIKESSVVVMVLHGDICITLICMIVD